MISYTKIGHFGRLGNQLFQFASTIGLARKLGYEVAFPVENMTVYNREHFKDGVTRDITFDVPKCFEIPEELLKPISEIHTHYEVHEPHFHYSEKLLSIPDGSNLNGYYQTEKYFGHIRTELSKILTFNRDVCEQAESKMPFQLDKVERVSIHLRRGDYAGLSQWHPVCDGEYYSTAINLFNNENNEMDKRFLIFSDDIDYCKHFFGEHDGIVYIENNHPYVDLCMMSMCEHNIIANSSFSWWAAWLNKNPNKTVIAPKKWFGPAYEGIHDTKDLYCKTWIAI